MIGLDAPESVDYGDKLKQKFGEEAHDFADSLLKNQHVRLSYDLQKYDKYGRTLAYAYLQDGRFVNEILIKNGFAVAYNYAPNITYKEIFSHAEDSAKIKKLGLWRD